MIEVEIAIEIHQFCCYATPTLFFQKETHTLALTMFWLIRSYQCIAAHDVAIEKFLWTPRRRGYKFNFTSRPINTNGSEYCPRKRRKRLFVFFFRFWIPVSICMQSFNPNRQWLPIRTFQRCRALFFIFYWFWCDVAAIITKCLQFHILPMSFMDGTMVFHIERIWDVKLFGNWISYVVQNPGQTTGSENLNHPHTKNMHAVHVCICM